MDTHLLCLRPVDQCRCDGEPHTRAAHDAITAELVACTLGQRQRLELRVDPAGKIQHALRAMLPFPLTASFMARMRGAR